jgi:hypothetical protein
MSSRSNKGGLRERALVRAMALCLAALVFSFAAVAQTQRSEDCEAFETRNAQALPRLSAWHAHNARGAD